MSAGSSTLPPSAASGPPRARRYLAAYLRAIEAHPDTAALRSDGLLTLLTIARGIVFAADWQTMRSRPTLARLQAVSGRSRRRVQTWCRWLEERGFLEVLEPGTTARYRPGVLHPDDPNLAREWRLVIPRETQPAVPPSPDASPALASARSAPRRLSAVQENGTPPRPGLRPVPETSTPSQARAREKPTAGPGKDQGHKQIGAPPAPSLPRPSPEPGAHPPPVRLPWPLGQNPHRGPERLAAAGTLTRRHPVLGRMSARGVRSVLREWFDQGYTPADVLWALERGPDGEAHHHGERVRVPAAWVRHRLSAWLGPGGQPMPPRSAQLLEAAQRHRLAVAAERQRLGMDRPRPAARQSLPAPAARELARRIAADSAARAALRRRWGLRVP